MLRSELEQHINSLAAKYAAERIVKGNDYSKPDEDVLSNFKETAARLGCTPLQAWGAHFTKHILSIERFIRDGVLSSEGIHGRIMDAHNYLHLLSGLLEEAKQQDELKNMFAESAARAEFYPETTEGQDVLNIEGSEKNSIWASLFGRK